MAEVTVRWVARPGEVFATGAWDASVDKLIPVQIEGRSQYGQVLSVRDAPDGRSVDFTVRLIQGDLGFGPDDECEGADAE